MTSLSLWESRPERPVRGGTTLIVFQLAVRIYALLTAKMFDGLKILLFWNLCSTCEGACFPCRI